MTILDAIRDRRPVKELPTSELRQQLDLFIAAKIWNGRYVAVSREVQNRTTREWMRQDVFGHTFDGVC